MKGLNDMLVCKWWGYIIHILGYNGQEKDGRLFSPTSLMFSHWCSCTSQLLSNVFRHQKMGENKYEYLPYIHRITTIVFLYFSCIRVIKVVNRIALLRQPFVVIALLLHKTSKVKIVVLSCFLAIRATFVAILWQLPPPML